MTEIEVGGERGPFSLKGLIETFGEDSRPVNVAKAKLASWNTDHDWHESVVDLWTQALEQIGFRDVKIAFSGFWSQGDGASFTANVDSWDLIEFLTTPREPDESIGYDGQNEDFRGWILHRIGWGIPWDHRFDWLNLIPDYLDLSVERTSHHYCHENTVKLQLYFRDHRCHDELESVVNDFREFAGEFVREVCQAIYRSLEEEYEWLTGDEQIMESAEANDYQFDESGEPA